MIEQYDNSEKEFNFSKENFDEICQYNRTHRIKIAQQELSNLIKDKKDGLKIISNKALLLLSYQGAIIAVCFNKFDCNFNIYFVILVSYIICFVLTGLEFLLTSKIDSQYIPISKLLHSDYNSQSDIELDYMICRYLEKVRINNDKAIYNRNKKLKQFLLASFILPSMLFVGYIFICYT